LFFPISVMPQTASLDHIVPLSRGGAHRISNLRVLEPQVNAARAGVLTVPSQICAGQRYGLSPGMLYERTLGDEPQRLLDATYHEIVRQDPPHAFLRLWVDDVGRWYSDLESEKESP